MTRFLLFILTIISLQSNAFAAEDKIVAIVNKHPITLSELEQRKKIMRFFGNIPALSSEQEKAFTNSMLNALIDDEVLTQHANKIGVRVVPQEVKNIIKNIETNNKMSDGHLEKTATNMNITHDTFNNFMRMNVLRNKIIHEVLGQDINVTRNEIDSLMLDTNSRDAKISLKIFTAKHNNDKAYLSMKKLSGRIRNCDNISPSKYASFASLSELNTTISALDPNLQSVIKDMHVGHASRVIKDDKLQVFVLCSKEIDNFSENDANQVHNIIAQKQLSIKAKKLFQTLRKKAYVKIVM